MRAFVTGATGFLGGRLTEKLAARGDEVVALARRDVSIGGAQVIRGDFDVARALSKGAREEARQRGQTLLVASSGMHEAEIELLADNPAGAAETALAAVAALEELGEHGWLSTVAGWAAEALYRLGRDDEAWAQTEKAEAAGAADDVITQMLIRQVRAKILARRGEHDEAERLVREALAFAEPTDMLDATGTAHLDFAVVLTAAGRREEAAVELAEARGLFAAKGNVVNVARVDRMLAEQSASIARLDS